MPLSSIRLEQLTNGREQEPTAKKMKKYIFNYFVHRQRHINYGYMDVSCKFQTLQHLKIRTIMLF
ncbi:hypothetical protein ABE15_20085 [Bacillus cereus]|nr:hypothetical protein [Bacillus cereus]